MKRRAIFKTAKFERQLDEQLEWYARHSDDVRVPYRFLEAIERSISEIAESPELFNRLIPKKGFEDLERFGLRFKRIDRRFPFYIYYQFDEQTIILRFIWHGKSDREQLIVDGLDYDQPDVQHG